MITTAKLTIWSGESFNRRHIVMMRYHVLPLPIPHEPVRSSGLLTARSPVSHQGQLVPPGMVAGHPLLSMEAPFGAKAHHWRSMGSSGGAGGVRGLNGR
jgi:hypothetical protein